MLTLHGNSFPQDHSEIIEGPFETPQEVTETYRYSCGKF